MNNLTAQQELVKRYSDTGDINLVLKIKESLKNMPVEEKIALGQSLDGQISAIPALPAVETFDSGREIDQSRVAINQIEVPAEEVVPPEIEKADAEIVEVIDEADKTIAATDNAQEIAGEDLLAKTTEVVQAATPVGRGQVREKLLAGDPNQVSAKEVDQAEQFLAQAA